MLLRPFSTGDAKEVQRLAGDRAITDTTLNIPHPYENGMAEAWISRHREQFDLGLGFTFAITRKEDGILLGAITLLRVVRGHQAELGYWVGQPYWNQGICTEAGAAVMQYGFKIIGLNRIYASHFTRNPASGRVMQKLSMKHEGRMRQHVMKWGKFESLDFYGILRDEWERVPRGNTRTK